MTDLNDKATKENQEMEPVVAEESSASEKRPVEAVVAPSSSREKRARKTAEAFVPDDFKHIEHQVIHIDGRGTQLLDLEPVRTSIEALPVTAPELLAAHKFLYPSQRKPPKQVIKSDILEFSGFLPKLQEGQDEKDVDESDDKLEVSIVNCFCIALYLVPPYLIRSLPILPFSRIWGSKPTRKQSRNSNNCVMSLRLIGT